MEKKLFAFYEKEFNNYRDILDVPEIEATFVQHDSYAMSYCVNIDFITLIIPFDKANGPSYNTIFVKNELVSYNKMYSEFYGTSVVEHMSFLDTAIELARRYTDCRELKFDELYPIAFITNEFIYQERIQTHRGLAFMGRLQESHRIANISVAQRDINETFNFTNPHNRVLFELVKDFMINYRLDESVLIEQHLAQKLISKNSKELKAKFLKDEKIKIDDYTGFKKRIVNDIKMKRPHKVIDIACGDDDIIYDLAKLNIRGGCKIYANDIALDYIQNYHSKKEDYRKIIFTNYNAIEAPFRKLAFDVLLCKNLLHHVDPSNREALIRNLLSISKQVVIVEILKPEEQNAVGKKIHTDFFGKVLNEAADKDYLGSTDIVELLKAERAEIDFSDIVDTGNGRYSYIWASKAD